MVKKRFEKVIEWENKSSGICLLILIIGLSGFLWVSWNELVLLKTLLIIFMIAFTCLFIIIIKDRNPLTRKVYYKEI